jgi:DNA polymerase-3 subunit delta'
MLFHGLRGVGKQRMALWTGQLQLCESPGPEGPCGECRGCRLALGLEHPDLHWYFPLPRPKGVSGDRLGDALESARIEALEERREHPLRPSLGDELRGLYLAMVQSLRRQAQLAPTMGGVQIFVLADAELLVPQESSPEAANALLKLLEDALLKLLEEPPRQTRFILTSSEPGRLLPTIRSRSVPLHLSPLPRDRVSGFLQERCQVDEPTADWAAGLGQGAIGRALGFLPEGDDPGPLEVLRREALELVDAALADGRARGYTAALDRSPAGARTMISLFGFVEEWLRDVSAVAAGADDQVLSRDVLPHLQTMVERAGVEPADAAGALLAAEDAREMARGNVNPQLIVSGLVRRLEQALRPRRVATTRSEPTSTGAP